MPLTNSSAIIHSALALHVSRFADPNGNFAPHTVGAGLEKIHGSHPGLKGALISTFNATHSSNNIICPVTGASFTPDTETGFSKFLHLGTTRIWNADGSVNEDRWDKFVKFVTEEQDAVAEKIVTQSRLKAYLAKCYEEDTQEANTGRNNHAIFSSKQIQGAAASAAWDEVFDRLTCGWQASKEANAAIEPYITLSLVREFFEDSAKAFQRAEDKVLPVVKPS